MLTLTVYPRKKIGKKNQYLRKEGFTPAVLYGFGLKPLNLQVLAKDFVKVYQIAGESSLLQLQINGQKEQFTVLIKDVQRDPISGEPMHIDFFQPRLTEKIEVKIPLVIEGESPVVKELGGTLVKNIPEIEIKALPQNLPKEIVVNVEKLKTFEDVIRVKDLSLPSGVETTLDPEEILIMVAEPEKVEEELAKPIEEKVEEVEKVEKEKKEKEEEMEENV